MKGSMRIQSREFSIIQHYGGGRDIPEMIGVNEAPWSGGDLPSVMSESIMLDSTVQGQCPACAM